MSEVIKFVYKKINHSQYKYELTQEYFIQIELKPFQIILSKYYRLYKEGLLKIKTGYQWDGASGPTIDTENIMRASCVHDVLYQMIRRKELPRPFKADCDRVLRKIMLEDGDKTVWNSIRAGYFYYAVRVFGWWSCRS